MKAQHLLSHKEFNLNILPITYFVDRQLKVFCLIKTGCLSKNCYVVASGGGQPTGFNNFRYLEYEKLKYIYIYIYIY